MHPNREKVVEDNEGGGKREDDPSSSWFTSSFVFPVGPCRNDKIPNFAGVGGEGVEEGGEAGGVREEENLKAFNT